MGWAVVTGATSGIGREFASQLAARSCDLVLVARDEARLLQTAAQLHERHDVAVEVLVADLSTDTGTLLVADRLRQDANPVDVLVNNAGLAIGQHFIGGELAREEYLLDVLVRAVLRLTHAALPGMVARGHGRVINVSSLAGFMASGTYSAAKSWVTVFTESLGQELAGTGVTATAVCPGLTHTEFHERAGLRMTGLPAFAWLSPELVAGQGLRDAFAGCPISVPGWQYKIATLALRYSPRPLIRHLRPPRRPSGAPEQLGQSAR